MHLVMFDIDGTLTRTGEIHDECFLQAIAEVLSIHDVDTDWLSYEHVTDSGILHEVIARRLDTAPDETTIDRIHQRFGGLLEDILRGDPAMCPAVDGGPEAFEALGRLPDQAIAIATGGWGMVVDTKLELAGYPTNLPAKATANDALAREDIMMLAKERAMSAYATEFETITYVGDGRWDVRATARVGWRFIGIGARKSARALRDEGAEVVIENYRDGDFIDVLRRVQSV